MGLRLIFNSELLIAPPTGGQIAWYLAPLRVKSSDTLTRLYNHSFCFLYSLILRESQSTNKQNRQQKNGATAVVPCVVPSS